ncbi:MAG: YncE family protein [Cuniculiplasma sp.]
MAIVIMLLASGILVSGIHTSSNHPIAANPEQPNGTTASNWGVVNTIPTGSINPSFAAYDSNNGYIYISDSGHSSVSVINSKTNQFVGNITVQSDPRGIAFDPRNGYLYVADSVSGNVSVINGSDDSVIANIPVWSYGSRSAQPGMVVYDTWNHLIYATISNSNDVSVINATKNTLVSAGPSLANFTSGEPPTFTPLGITFDSENGNVYVTGDGFSCSGNYTGYIYKINNETSSPVYIHPIATVGLNPQSLAWDSLNGLIYVENTNSNNVTVFNPANNRNVANINVGSTPEYAIFDKQTGNMLVL